MHDGDGGVINAETVVNLVALDEVILIRAVRRPLHHDAPRVVVVAIAADVVLSNRDVDDGGLDVNAVTLWPSRATIVESVALDREVAIRGDAATGSVVGPQREPIGI